MPLLTQIPKEPRLRVRYPEEVPELHLLLADLEDDRRNSRLREGLWISIIIHLVAFLVFLFAPRYFPQSSPDLREASPLDNKSITYVEMNPDAQKAVTTPRTNIISDKNRIATSRNPTIDRKSLEELRPRSRAGAPGAMQPQAPQQQPAQMAQASRPPPNPGENSQPPAPALDNEEPQLPVRSKAGSHPFSANAGMSAGSAIEQAARATAANRMGGVGAGEGGEGGLGGRSNSSVKSQIDVLSDTMGVDFSAYLQRVLHDVRINWYNLIPEVARPPLLKQGKVGIEFAILKDGSVQGMKLVTPSGDVSLDRAAWGGITGSNPFPPLPSQFRGQYLALRFHFYYNPRDNELR